MSPAVVLCICGYYTAWNWKLPHVLRFLWILCKHGWSLTIVYLKHEIFLSTTSFAWTTVLVSFWTSKTHGLSLEPIFLVHCVHMCKPKSLISNINWTFPERCPGHLKAYLERERGLPPQVLVFSDDEEIHSEINSFIQNRA